MQLVLKNNSCYYFKEKKKTMERADMPKKEQQISPMGATPEDKS